MMWNITAALPSAVRTATTTWDPTVQLAGAGRVQPIDADVLYAILNVTVAPGGDTVLLKLQEQIPATGVWVDYPSVATLAQVATGIIRLQIGPSITNIPASVAGVGSNIYLPPVWRLQVVHSGVGAFTYSLDVCTQREP